ncbi:SdpI family protein [Candidatus Kuenenbacteria bacterium]|nr:SdpI family protein [Candidatus Kuenenbacteria bacterium]
MKNPLCPTLKTEILPILFVIVSIVLSFYFYAHFPARVATHWNIQGQVDGWSSRGFAAFFFPLLNLAIYLLMLYIPYLDPKKSNYEKFHTAYHAVKAVLVIFLTLIYFVVSLNALGYAVPVNLVVPLGIGILFIIIGYYLDRVKQNWFMGIRTPWAMSSETVWQKTHHFGSRIFMLSGFLLMIASFLSQWFWAFLLIIFLLVLSTFLYSYLVYRQEHRN